MKRKNIEMVDLGLPSGLKWANCNIGANKETEYGLYFKFGEVEGHDTQNCTHDKYPHEVGLDKYGVLLPVYDAATITYGSGFRMPTYAEMKELIAYTNHSVATIDGIEGMRFSKKDNANTYIFIPFAGNCYNGIYGGAGKCSFVRSSNYNRGDPFFLYCDRTVNAIIDKMPSSSGGSVRAVHE